MVEGCRVRVTGPLAGYVDGFRERLAGHGYTVQVRDRNLRLLASVSRWMAERELSAAELTVPSSPRGVGWSASPVDGHAAM